MKKFHPHHQTKRQLWCAKNRSNFAVLFNVSQSHRFDCNTSPLDIDCKAVKSAGITADQNSPEDRCTRSNTVWAVFGVELPPSFLALPSSRSPSDLKFDARGYRHRCRVCCNPG